MLQQSPTILEVSDATFQTEVIEHSRQRPVIVDFWAQWCGPCKVLGPALEKLANEYRGAFRLAKVDVDRNPQLALAARVQSIPMVMAVWDNAIVDRFVGALPPAEVKRFVDSILEMAGVAIPSKQEAAVPDDPVKAEKVWRKQLERDEKDGKALLGLGQALIQQGRSEEARTVLERVKSNQEEYSAAHNALNLLDLLSEVAAAGGESQVRDRLATNPQDARNIYLVACADAGRGRFLKALEALVPLVADAPADVREDARKAAGKVFMVTGREDERVESLRRQLARLLF